jgi:hypothetical protein
MGLDAVAASVSGPAPEVALEAVARGGAVAAPQ